MPNLKIILQYSEKNAYPTSRRGSSLAPRRSLVPRMWLMLSSPELPTETDLLTGPTESFLPLMSLAVASPITKMPFNTASRAPILMLLCAAASRCRSQLRRMLKCCRVAAIGCGEVPDKIMFFVILCGFKIECKFTVLYFKNII